MSGIQKLPCEIIALIFKKFDNVRFLLPTILTCRHFYTSYLEDSSIKQEILRNQIPSALLRYSIAAKKCLNFVQPSDVASVNELLDKLYNEPGTLELDIHEMTLGDIVHMGHLHDLIHGLVVDFSTSAWSSLSNNKLILSPTEHFRFCRAFYRFEILCNLFRREDHTSGGDMDAKRYFLSRHPPWENEQIGCIYDLLEDRLSAAIHDVLTQDIEYGEFSMNYLEYGGDSYWKQGWLSQGLQFVHRLMNESSYDTKQALLNSEDRAAAVMLHDRLNGEHDEVHWYDEKPLSQYTEEELSALSPGEDLQDTDEGPQIIWRAAHSWLPRGVFVMYDKNVGLRQRAYVLWDADRLRRYNVLERLDTIKESIGREYTDEDYNAMVASWEERSKIWLAGVPWRKFWWNPYSIFG